MPVLEETGFIISRYTAVSIACCGLTECKLLLRMLSLSFLYCIYCLFPPNRNTYRKGPLQLFCVCDCLNREDWLHVVPFVL